MFDEFRVATEIRKFLSLRDRPSSFDEIFAYMTPILTEQTPANVYSPARTYAVGDRLYHPAEELRAWFTVMALEDGGFMQVAFEDGSEKCFRHTSRAVFSQASGTIGTFADMQNEVSQILGQMPDVQAFGDFYTVKSAPQDIHYERVSDHRTLEKYFALLAHGSEIDTNRRANFQRVCGELKLHSMYYISSIDNLPGILRDGILCYNLAPASRTSFANEEIQNNRHHTIPDHELGFTLHDYAPLFFSERPPLLYQFREKPGEVIKLRVSTAVLLEPGAIFHNMNAISTHVLHRCFRSFDQLPQLNWGLIHGAQWQASNDEEKHVSKLYCQAEADIPLLVKPKYIEGITVCDAAIQRDVSKIVAERKLNIAVMADAARFF